MELTPVGLSRLAVALPGAEDAAPTGGAAPRPNERAPAPRIGVIRNPRSHRNRGAGPEELDTGGVITVVPKDREELGETLARFAAERIDVLVIDGGDGTMRDVLTRGMPVFGAQWPRIVVLPKGKTNALAVDLGLPRRWPLAEALRDAGRARVVTRRPIVIERPGTPDWQATGFIMGTGVFNAAIDAGQVAHRFGAFQGFAVALTALFTVVQALFGFGNNPWRALSGMRMRLGADRREVPHSRHGAPDQRFGAGFSSLDNFPLGMRPFSNDDRGIRFVVVDAPLRRVVALLPVVLMGLDRPFLPALGIHRGGGEEIALDLDTGFILDGEAFPPGSYRLRLGPELHFVVP